MSYEGLGGAEPGSLAGSSGRTLLGEWEDNSTATNAVYLCVCVFLVLVAGLMSGLTLGLMSLDKMELEVLKRSGTPAQQKHATRIMPIISNAHLLLVTLLLCNACAMEALPIFLDRLVNPIGAILISVTMVLIFGEILPQAVCSRHGLAIGSSLSWLVRGIIILCMPISWPISKLLDRLLGNEHHALFRRGQLKALVDIHGMDEGLGGNLTEDEIQVICGALDLTSKTARKSMTPLNKVFMLSTEDRLTEGTCQSILDSGHSRIPVYKDGDRTNIVGLILVKEMLQYKAKDEVPVSQLRMRTLPRLPADTPMYDMLNLFQTGRSHIAVLIDSPQVEEEPDPDSGAAAGGPGSGNESDKSADPSPRERHRGRDFVDFLTRRSRPLLSGDGDDSSPGSRRGTQEDGPRVTMQRTASDPAPFPPFDPRPEDQLAIGIITIEDVIEELMQAEIVDETDNFTDNEKLHVVNRTALADALPAKLRKALASQPELFSHGQHGMARVSPMIHVVKPAGSGTGGGGAPGGQQGSQAGTVTMLAVVKPAGAAAPSAAATAAAVVQAAGAHRAAGILSAEQRERGSAAGSSPIRDRSGHSGGAAADMLAKQRSTTDLPPLPHGAGPANKGKLVKKSASASALPLIAFPPVGDDNV